MKLRFGLLGTSLYDVVVWWLEDVNWGGGGGGGGAGANVGNLCNSETEPKVDLPS